MGKIFFFTGEALRAIKRNVAPTTAAVVTTVLTALLLGVLIPVFQTAQSKGEDVRGQLELRTFLYDDATKAETQALMVKLEGLPHVESVTLLTKADAKKEFLASDFGKQNPDALKQLGGKNPLPANFVIKPDDASNLEGIRNAIQPVGAKGDPQYISPIIASVDDRQEDARDIEQVTGALKLILTVITVLLICASLLLIGNTIRLSIYTRRREIEVMRLVGATRWFIRWPFMIEGVVVGILGGAIAILVLWIGKVTVVDPLSDKFALMNAQDSMSFAALVGCLFIAAILVSAIGSGLTMRRFLKV
ncbi:MAG TPA: permease-like cell division protein FtsX [Solirubrobacterales bacterium]|nr:ABC transporter permease [Solirubrobacterales bacterium]HMU26976.1 permease-like cell division protein FtsX [Solirubrobacterales bacterium]HMW44917.1 permease-like cell division protein FtsX [Solirubrobacterales bacterium]HMX70666.1 permease-like cell division protein FtsX [Solirubrobacterales bacterium]HMY25539.1 permease-like cell division protein FtsX [Solirubrobacterales bacterium]